MPKPVRKTFLLNDDEDMIVSAGGVILYRVKKGNVELLIAESRGLYEDLGGCVDKEDVDIFETVAREAFEESNELISKSKIKKRLKKDVRFCYSKRSKYVTYIIKANTDEAKLKSDDFGDKEIHDDIFRKIKWLPLDVFLSKDIIDHKLNFRLKNKKLFEILTDIKNQNKLGISIFTDSSDELREIIRSEIAKKKKNELKNKELSKK